MFQLISFFKKAPFNSNRFSDMASDSSKYLMGKIFFDGISFLRISQIFLIPVQQSFFSIKNAKRSTEDL